MWVTMNKYKHQEKEEEGVAEEAVEELQQRPSEKRERAAFLTSH